MCKKDCKSSNIPEFLTPLITEEIDGTFSRNVEIFKYYCAILKQEINIPKDFVNDYESVPIFRSTAKKPGVIHDYFSCFDSVPIVSKMVAAKIYLEALRLKDEMTLKTKTFGSIKKGLFKTRKLLKRMIKFHVVLAWPGYFHRRSVKATYKQLIILNNINDKI